MPVGQFGVQIEQVGIGLDAIDATCSDQAREPCPTTCSVIVTGKKCVAVYHGGASDRILDQVGIHVDMAILQEQTEALLTSQPVGQSLSQFGLARDTAGLSVQPNKEFIDQRAGFSPELCGSLGDGVI